MWLACFLLLVVILVWQLWSAGPRQALGVVVVLSLLAPSWIVLNIGGLPIHLRAIAGILGLGAYCISPNARINWKLGAIDLLGLALLAVHVLSDWNTDGVRLNVPFRAYGEWAIPFLAGRLALQRVDDVRNLLPYIVAVSLIFAIVSATESLCGINVVEQIFGDRPVDQFPREATRLGLKRSFGPTMHPIYFGALQTLLFSWTLYAASRAQRHSGPKWWRWTPWLAASGVFFTVSRAPLLGMGVVLYVTAVVTKPAYRKILWTVVFVGIVGGVIGWKSVLDGLHRWGGELQHNRGYVSTIVIDDHKHIYSGTLTRIYLFDVYGQAMRRAGWLGFGTERTTGFPVNVPVGQQHTETLRRLPWIDNVYILLILRFGYLGVIVFLLMGVAAIATYISLINRPYARGIVFCAGTAGGLVATMLLMLTVWMPHDFGFWYLWTIGAASGLAGMREPEYDDYIPQRQSAAREKSEAHALSEF